MFNLIPLIYFCLSRISEFKISVSADDATRINVFIDTTDCCLILRDCGGLLSCLHLFKNESLRISVLSFVRSCGWFTGGAVPVGFMLSFISCTTSTGWYAAS